MSGKIIVWKTGHVRFRNEPLLVPVEVERVSEHSVWINGRKRSKISGYESYHDTFALAKDRVKKSLERRLANAQDEAGRVEGDLLLLANTPDPTGAV